MNTKVYNSSELGQKFFINNKEVSYEEYRQSFEKYHNYHTDISNITYNQVCENNNMLQIKVEKIHPDAIIPTQATPGSAGFDLHSIKSHVIKSNGTIIIDTGLRFELPEGYLMYISSKSGLAAKNGLCVLNSPALIDSDYRGEVSVIIHNTDKLEYYVAKGQKIAQAVILPYPKVIITEGKVGVNTQRGENGFGSTGL